MKFTRRVPVGRINWSAVVKHSPTTVWSTKILQTDSHELSEPSESTGGHQVASLWRVLYIVENMFWDP
jgi:hypothetical protein